MKRIYFLLSFVLIAFTSCSDDGEMGPPGPPGPQGPAGIDGLVGAVFEKEIDFGPETYSEIVPIPSSIEVLDSDVVLVYLLEYVDEETGYDVWSLLPQTFYLDGGQLVYNYNHTLADVQIFLDGTIDLNTLGGEYTDNQIFRIVVLPAEFAQDNSLDVSNYEAVMSALDIQESEIPQLEL